MCVLNSMSRKICAQDKWSQQKKGVYPTTFDGFNNNLSWFINGICCWSVTTMILQVFAEWSILSTIWTQNRVRIKIITQFFDRRVNAMWENENKYLDTKKFRYSADVARSLLLAKYKKMGAISMAWLTKHTHQKITFLRNITFVEKYFTSDWNKRALGDSKKQWFLPEKI